MFDQDKNGPFFPNYLLLLLNDVIIHVLFCYANERIKQIECRLVTSLADWLVLHRRLICFVHYKGPWKTIHVHRHMDKRLLIGDDALVALWTIFIRRGRASLCLLASREIHLVATHRKSARTLQTSFFSIFGSKQMGVLAGEVDVRTGKFMFCIMCVCAIHCWKKWDI